MFGPGGHAYVYLCYGIHHLFNVVVGDVDQPLAILVRAGDPLIGIDTMLERRSKERAVAGLLAGPGCLAQGLGITTALTGYQAGLTRMNNAAHNIANSSTDDFRGLRTVNVSDEAGVRALTVFDDDTGVDVAGELLEAVQGRNQAEVSLRAMVVGDRVHDSLIDILA